VIRPLRPGDIVAFPYLDAIGRYIADDATPMFEWYVPPGGSLCLGYPSAITTADTDDLDTMVDTGELVIVATDFESLTAYDAFRTYRDCDPRRVTPGGAPATSHLELRVERGHGARKRVNGFLKHPTVQYQHDPVTKPFRIALTAVSNGRDVGSVRADSDTGNDLIEGAWHSTMQELSRKLAVVRAGFEQFTDEEILEGSSVEATVEPWNPLGLATDEADSADTYTSDVRWAMHGIGRYDGPVYYLYDEYGTAIRAPSEYRNFLETIATGDTDNDQEWFVTPVDVHY